MEKGIAQVSPPVTCYMVRHGHHPHGLVWVGDKTDPGKVLARLLCSGERGRRTIRWHSFHQMATTQLHRLGLPVPRVTLWGGWNSEKGAKIYPPTHSGDSSGAGPCCVPHGLERMGMCRGLSRAWA